MQLGRAEPLQRHGVRRVPLPDHAEMRKSPRGVGRYGQLEEAVRHAAEGGEYVWSWYQLVLTGARPRGWEGTLTEGGLRASYLWGGTQLCLNCVVVNSEAKRYGTGTLVPTYAPTGYTT